MSLTLPLISSTATVREHGRVLAVHDAGTGPAFEVRVDDGVAFARHPADEARSHWQDVALSSIMAHFAADSPVATFLRRQGVNPLRQLLTDLATPTGDASAGEASPPGAQERDP